MLLVFKVISIPVSQCCVCRPADVAGVVHWAENSKDPILLRWGAGALARSVAAGDDSQRAVAAAGGIPALLSAMNCSDPQAQCFGSAAVGKRATSCVCATCCSSAVRSIALTCLASESRRTSLHLEPHQLI